MRGLSPRARGNLSKYPLVKSCPRTIPASTGEPCYQWAEHKRTRDYPREHGGTPLSYLCGQAIQGLSPRARGNRFGGGRTGRRAGTIPASTGEPLARHCRRPHDRDYPREHGGTPAANRAKRSRVGLSPRARGNPLPEFCRRGHGGTIPASTGEPSASGWLASAIRDYPREHGGTRLSGGRPWPAGGTIPASTGEPFAGANRGRYVGTIPASTGEPLRLLRLLKVSGDYPREHGGT